MEIVEVPTYQVAPQMVPAPINVLAIPTPYPLRPPVMRSWHFGLCTCCLECGACMEVCCCYPCQLSRQYNLMNYQRAEINLWACCAFMCMDTVCPVVFPSRCYALTIRQNVRERFAIRGSGCGDCCTMCCCWCCSLQQVLLELTSCGECPGSCFGCVSQISPRPPPAML